MLLPIMFLLASMATGTPPAVSAQSTIATVAEVEAHKSPQTFSQYVRRYFTEDPILANIAWCESRLRHVGSNGEILRGVVNSDDIGVMQINTRFHGKRAESLGIDLYSLNGNLEYAQYLYDKEGTKPWSASQACWGKIAKK